MTKITQNKALLSTICIPQRDPIANSYLFYVDIREDFVSTQVRSSLEKQSMVMQIWEH